MAKVKAKKKQTSETVVRSIPIIAQTERSVVNLENRILKDVAELGTFTGLRLLANAAIHLIHMQSRVRQQRVKLYRHHMKLIRMAAEANSLDMKDMHDAILHDAKKEAELNQARLKRAQENSGWATLGSDPSKPI